MEHLNKLQGIDIYLLDQLLKHRIQPGQRVLDAGCGTGRNLRFFIEEEFDCVGIDPNSTAIESLIQKYPNHSDNFLVSSIEDYSDSEGFDVIICNAVLHFSKDHSHFDQQFSALCKLLQKDGLLFIRMTSDIGIELPDRSTNGVYLLPDGTQRYLITRERISTLLNEHELKLLDPVKSTNVGDLRSMTTLVFRAP